MIVPFRSLETENHLPDGILDPHLPDGLFVEDVRLRGVGRPVFGERPALEDGHVERLEDIRNRLGRRRGRCFGPAPVLPSRSCRSCDTSSRQTNRARAVTARTAGCSGQARLHRLVILPDIFLDRNLDDIFLVEAQVGRPHLMILPGEDDRPDEENDGQGELENDENFPEGRAFPARRRMSASRLGRGRSPRERTPDKARRRIP